MSLSRPIRIRYTLKEYSLLSGAIASLRDYQIPATSARPIYDIAASLPRWRALVLTERRGVRQPPEIPAPIRPLSPCSVLNGIWSQFVNKLVRRHTLAARSLPLLKRGSVTLRTVDARVQSTPGYSLHPGTVEPGAAGRGGRG